MSIPRAARGNDTGLHPRPQTAAPKLSERFSDLLAPVGILRHRQRAPIVRDRKVEPPHHSVGQRAVAQEDGICGTDLDRLREVGDGKVVFA